MSPYKTLPQALHMTNSRPLHTQWNAVSRIDWFESPLARFAPGLSLNFRQSLPPQIGITVDGEGLTAFSSWEGKDSAAFVKAMPSWILYEILPASETVLILQVVGGQEVLIANHAKVSSIDVQTAHTLIAQWLETTHRTPAITLIAEKARTYLAATSKRYDRIVVSLEGALPSGGTGMNALQESSLETMEGAVALLQHLSPQGWLSVHRYLLPPPRAELRWIGTLIAAMKHMGWNPSQQMGVFRTVSTIMILVSPQKWSLENRQRFEQFNSFVPSAVILPFIILKWTFTWQIKSINLLAPCMRRLFRSYLKIPKPFTNTVYLSSHRSQMIVPFFITSFVGIVLRISMTA